MVIYSLFNCWAQRSLFCWFNDTREAMRAKKYERAYEIRVLKVRFDTLLQLFSSWFSWESLSRRAKKTRWGPFYHITNLSLRTVKAKTLFFFRSRTVSMEHVHRHCDSLSFHRQQDDHHLPFWSTWVKFCLAMRGERSNRSNRQPVSGKKIFPTNQF